MELTVDTFDDKPAVVSALVSPETPKLEPALECIASSGAAYFVDASRSVRAVTKLGETSR